MKRQNDELRQEELEELNKGLKDALDQVPIEEEEHLKEFQAVEEVPEEEEEQPQKKDSPLRRKKKSTRIATGVLVGVLAVLLICVGVFAGLRNAGKNSLIAGDDINITAPDIEGADISVENNGDLVVYNGQKYCYNHNIITVLCMGIDKRQEETEDNELNNGNGQADTIILVAIDSETGRCSLINISRDSMVDVDQYTVDGNYAGTDKMQLTLAYTYGGGERNSCRNVAKSVSNLFYGVPISSYASINLSAINVLNDAVGGVEVQVLEDLSAADPELELGATVTLKGSQAETYVRSRDAYSGDANSNSLRMDRQKQYLSSFARKTLEQTRADLTVPLTLFDVASSYMVTDLNAARVSYLVSLVNKIGFEESSFVTVPGEAVVGEEGYAEYNVDDKSLYEMILDVFYEKTE
ncbi:MAG: LCP family protein [Lachnospiraceae bacterium]|nr:LCP family protein [Lachnospiraceae bacterium]